MADPVKRREHGLLPTGGSYVIHQRWIHDTNSFHKLSEEEQEKIVGRTKPDSARLANLPKDSHVARSRDDKDNQIPIIRQSMPFGTEKGPHGLLFIAYSNSPARFDTVQICLSLSQDLSSSTTEILREREADLKLSCSCWIG